MCLVWSVWFVLLVERMNMSGWMRKIVERKEGPEGSMQSLRGICKSFNTKFAK